MRITARQLRQIIKEELKRSSQMYEEDFFSYDDIEREEQEEFGRKMAKTADPFAGLDLDDPESPPDAAVKMPGAPAASSMKGTAAAAASAGVSTGTINRIQGRIEEINDNLDADAPGAMDIGGIVYSAYGDPMTVAKLAQVAEGSRILSRGARGKDVVVAQALLLGTLRDASDMIVGRRGAYEDDPKYMKATREAEMLGARGIVRKALTGEYITYVELSELLVSVLGADIGLEIDGVFGDATFNAVVAAQLCAKYLSSIGNEFAVIDGKIGRQTMSYLLGFKELGMPTGSDLNRFMTTFTGDKMSSREIKPTGGLARGDFELSDLQERKNRRAR